MKRSKLASILKKAEIISKAIEAEAEEILEDAEKAVKETVPACNITSALAAIENNLGKEGIEALFQKSVSKIAMRRTAADGLDAKSLEELVSKITKAIVEEFEDVLKDADEVCDEEVAKLGDGEDITEIEGKLKGILEKKLAGKGIYTQLARTAKVNKTAARKNVAPKVNVAEKAENALANMRAKRK